ncbi:MAG: amino acid ABC transporter permease [Thermoleophilia bacterium]
MDALAQAFADLERYFFNIEILGDVLPQLLPALLVVFQILFFSLLFSFMAGLTLALLRMVPFRPLRWLVTVYVDFFRALPLLLLLTYIYYGLALFGSTTGLRFLILDPIPAAILGITMTYAAYSAEIFRAGISSIPHGQLEAARSLGMTSIQAMRYVVLPQTMRVVVPPLTNELIAMIKDTALASVITTPELLFRAREIMGLRANPTPLTAAAILYVVFTLPLIRVAVRLERKYGKGARPVGL